MCSMQFLLGCAVRMAVMVEPKPCHVTKSLVWLANQRAVLGHLRCRGGSLVECLHAKEVLLLAVAISLLLVVPQRTADVTALAYVC